MIDQPALQAVNEKGEPVDMRVFEDAGVAFDPTSQHLDLTKDEKRRTTALMMAIQAYDKLIIKEAAYLERVSELARRGQLAGVRDTSNNGGADGGWTLQPATIDAMVIAALKFDAFIADKYSESSLAPAQEVEPKEEDKPKGDLA